MALACVCFLCVHSHAEGMFASACWLLSPVLIYLFLCCCSIFLCFRATRSSLTTLVIPVHRSTSQLAALLKEPLNNFMKFLLLILGFGGKRRFILLVYVIVTKKSAEMTSRGARSRHVSHTACVFVMALELGSSRAERDGPRKKTRLFYQV